MSICICYFFYYSWGFCFGTISIIFQLLVCGISGSPSACCMLVIISAWEVPKESNHSNHGASQMRGGEAHGSLLLAWASSQCAQESPPSGIASRCDFQVWPPGVTSRYGLQVWHTRSGQALTLCIVLVFKNVESAPNFYVFFLAIMGGRSYIFESKRPLKIKNHWGFSRNSLVSKCVCCISMRTGVWAPAST